LVLGVPWQFGSVPGHHLFHTFTRLTKGEPIWLLAFSRQQYYPHRAWN